VQHGVQAPGGIGAALVETVVEHGDVAPLVLEAVRIRSCVRGPERGVVRPDVGSPN
jgi:hypothetical protein